MYFVLYVGVIALALSLVSYWLNKMFKKSRCIDGKHVMITGGSSGIGKSVAKEVAKKGASISLLARDYVKLEAAKEELDKYLGNSSKQQIRCYAVDVSAEYSKIETIVKRAEEDLGPVYMLVNCAGTSTSARFEVQQPSEFKRMMDVNYFGSVYVTRAVVPSMKKRTSGIVVFTSSMGGLAGLYGYTSYSASKFALRGLAECLQMEVKPYNISVTVSFPPDTDTPGFAEEEKIKPLETRLISKSGGLISADVVATQLVHDSLEGNYSSVVGFEGYLLSTLCAGMSPVSSLSSLLKQSMLMGIFRFISAFYLTKFDSIIKHCIKQRDRDKKSN